MILKGISPLISPELLKVLAQMEHGDEIVLVGTHFGSLHGLGYMFNEINYSV
jgi:L-fucose mutarotase